MLNADYLIVGAGAVGMIFADQILTELPDARIVMVDRHARPGGHWNEAYPFVRLHQPSAYYGAGSRQLGSNRIEESGVNRGYFEQASGAEVLHYFDALMRERFLPSGRVDYFPMCAYRGDGEFVELMSGQSQHVRYRKLVDATFFNTQTPATHTRSFEVGPDVTIAAPHELPRQGGHVHYVILGSGKTAMDVGVWLLQMGVDPNAIQWVKPRDAWLLNREVTQPGDDFYRCNMGGLALQLEAAAEATSKADLFARLERARQLLRIDRDVTPSMYRGATISEAEVALLRRIENVVRGGRVRRIEADRIVLDHGVSAVSPGALFIDCTASALPPRAPKQIFDGERITIQMVRAQLISISAATVAHVEAAYGDDAAKNALCQPIPAAASDTDWLTTTLADLRAAKTWASDKPLRRWVSEHRLSGFGSRGKDDPEAVSIGRRLLEARPRAEANLVRLLEAEHAEPRNALIHAQNRSERLAEAALS
jgi:hypothetical protein